MSDKSDKKMEKENGVDQTRRGLAKAGVIAAPVLMTLSSKSAFAVGRECTPSNLASGNLSSPVDYDTCGGCTPGYWGSAPHADYPGAGYAKTDLFKTVFGYASALCSYSGGADTSACLDVTPFADTDQLINVVSNPPTSTINPGNEVLDHMTANHGNYQNWQGMLVELGRQAVAAFLNASHPSVFYAKTPAQVVLEFTTAVNAFITNYNGAKPSIDKHILEAQKDIFDTLNNQGICPLGRDTGKK